MSQHEEEGSLSAVRALARALPGVEEGTCYGTPALRVGGRLFARLREDGETLVVRVDPFERELLLAEHPDVLFLTDHYRRAPWVLVRLAVVETAALGTLLEAAWRLAAPRRLHPAREASRD